LIGQKLPLKRKEIRSVRIRLQLAQRTRNLALFNLAIDSKLREYDLVELHVGDIALGIHILPRATIMQQKTHCRVQFRITEQTRVSIAAWIDKAHLSAKDYLFPSRVVDGGRAEGISQADFYAWSRELRGDVNGMTTQLADSAFIDLGAVSGPVAD
jgi:hypothetical protein